MITPLHLCRLRLNPEHPEVQRDVQNGVSMHKRLLKAFPERPEARENRALFGLLFRTEPEGIPLPTLLVQSEVVPDWSCLPRGYLHPLAGFEMRRIETQISNLPTNRVFQFRLRASPVRTIRSPMMHRGRRVPLLEVEEIRDWLARKGNAGGFRLLSPPSVQRERPVQDRKRSPGPLVLQSILFEGRLQVTDPVLIAETIRQGIGPGKAYGMGLLSLAADA